MNKKLLISLFICSFFNFGCGQNIKTPKKVTDENISEESAHSEWHKKHDEISKITNKELHRLDSVLIGLYKLNDSQPELVLNKLDSILNKTENETDKIMLTVQDHILNTFRYSKAELLYKAGEYEKSIQVIKSLDYNTGENAAGIAANYIKLKDNVKAKNFIDSIGKGYYIYNYVLGNYYESTGLLAKAKEVYRKIKNDKSVKHYIYYNWAVNRLNELQKENPKPLDEIYFPTGLPDFEITIDDNDRREKIFEIFNAMPEVQKNHYNVYIFGSPINDDTDYYWVKIGENKIKNLKDLGNFDNFKTKYNFFVYPKDWEIKFYEPKNKSLISLKEWRENRKNRP